MRQRLQQCVVMSPWDAGALFDRIAGLVERELPEVTAFVIDDTDFPKKGRHSVGVARQYSGTLGRTDNCQIATSLHLAGERGSACIGMRLYLPETWASDRPRCRAAGVPDAVAFAPKWQHTLALLDAALATGVRRHVVLGDAAFGEVTAFRDALTARDLSNVLRVPGHLVVWPPGTQFLVPTRRGAMGRPHSNPRPTSPSSPLTIAAVAATLPHRRVTWREGSRGRQAARFAAVRVRLAHRHAEGVGPSAEVWFAQWMATGRRRPDEILPIVVTGDDPGPHARALRQTPLAHRARLSRTQRRTRPRSFEGRTWNGFHHHVALCAAAHAFLALRRALFPSAIDGLDDRRGPPASASAVAASSAAMPAVSSAHGPHASATRALTHVIK
jgi:SRSO17 transposase